jgi:8-oxo-dGTP diphosphatase
MLPKISYTLCFLTRGDQILMLERRNPPNQGLWNGVGGHLEPGETPLASCLREVQEETGFRLSSARFGGILTWEGFEIPPNGLYIFTAPAPEGDPAPCSEGRLAWQPRTWVFSSPQVVSNIHRFGPLVFEANHPKHFHFIYAGGEIQNWSVAAYPDLPVL